MKILFLFKYVLFFQSYFKVKILIYKSLNTSWVVKYTYIYYLYCLISFFNAKKMYWNTAEHKKEKQV